MCSGGAGSVHFASAWQLGSVVAGASTYEGCVAGAVHAVSATQKGTNHRMRSLLEARLSRVSDTLVPIWQYAGRSMSAAGTTTRFWPGDRRGRYTLRVRAPADAAWPAPATPAFR